MKILSNWIFNFPSLFLSLKKRVFKCVFKVDFLISDLALTTNPLMKVISTQPLIYIFEPDKQNYPELVLNLRQAQNCKINKQIFLQPTEHFLLTPLLLLCADQPTSPRCQ